MEIEKLRAKKTSLYLFLCYMLEEETAIESMIAMKNSFNTSKEDMKLINKYAKKCFSLIKEKTELKNSVQEKINIKRVVY